MSDTEFSLNIQGLEKIYKGSGASPDKHALKGIDLQIKKGSIFGLLGPNGAGKSTLINILAGLVVKSAGSVEIGGFNLDTQERRAKASIGIVPQEITFDAFFTPRKALELQAGLYGIPAKDRITDELLDFVNLSDKAESYARTLSGGMKRRLMIAKAMVHRPSILVLDEPTAGVDIELRKQLWSNVRALNKQGVTVILTTHYLEEAQEMCEEIAIINHGEIIARDSTEALLNQFDTKEISFTVDRAVEAFGDKLAALGASKKHDNVISFTYSPESTPVGTLIDHVRKDGYGIVDIASDESDLEDVFLQLTHASN